MALVGLEDIPIPFIARRQLLEIRDLFTTCCRDLADKNLQAYKAFLLFGHTQRLKAFQREWAASVKANTLRQLMNTILFPPHKEWGRINFRAWGDAFHQHGIYKTKHTFAYSSAKIDPIREAGVISLLRTKFALAVRPYEDILPGSTLKQITDLSVQWRLNPNEYKRALKIYACRMDKPDERHTLPELYIRGERFGVPGGAFYALDRDDPIKLFIGNYTGCCERIADIKNNIEDTIEHSYLRTSSTFYVVSDGKKIIAHSWAWRGQKSAFCLDGFESDDTAFNAGVMKNLLEEIAAELHRPEFAEYGFKNFMVGKCAKHLEPGRDNYPRLDTHDVKPREIEDIGMNKIYLSGMMARIA